MATAQKQQPLTRLAGKKVVFQGRFGWGERERLSAMTEAQKGTIAEDLDGSIDYLVLPDLSAGKTAQKKAATLNGKGASIQVVDGAAFEALMKPDAEELLELLRGGRTNAGRLSGIVGHRYHYHAVGQPALWSFAAESLDGVNLGSFQFSHVSFEHCSFKRCILRRTHFDVARQCDFGGAEGEGAYFADVAGSRFVKAVLKEASFDGIEGADFTDAVLEGARFLRDLYAPGSARQHRARNVIFTGTWLRSAQLADLSLDHPDFTGADLAGATLQGCTFQGANFRDAKLGKASLFGCKLPNADFTGADLAGANLGDADLTGAIVEGADLAGCNLRGANLDGVDLSKAKNHQLATTTGGAAGPALAELDTLTAQAKRISFTFHVSTTGDGDGEAVGVDSSGLKWGWALRVPHRVSGNYYHARSGQTMSDAMVELANLMGSSRVRYETLEVSSTKSPKSGKELRELVLAGIAEAFDQPLPPAEELAAAARAWRDARRQQGAAQREQREKLRQEQEQQQAKEKKKIAAKVAKAVGKVTDIASFLKALEVRADKQKIDKATKMLKAERFKLFNDVTGEYLAGVVKSQTDPDLVYACRVDQDGKYACCTQNLNICGGLRGSICKHLLVLIIGLVKAGELDPTTIDGWVAKTHDQKPALDKEAMGEIFIRYKGAEAGEVDWRPTETLPEDYYSL